MCVIYDSDLLHSTTYFHAQNHWLNSVIPLHFCRSSSLGQSSICGMLCISAYSITRLANQTAHKWLLWRTKCRLCWNTLWTWGKLISVDKLWPAEAKYWNLSEKENDELASLAQILFSLHVYCDHVLNTEKHSTRFFFLLPARFLPVLFCFLMPASLTWLIKHACTWHNLATPLFSTCNEVAVAFDDREYII